MITDLETIKISQLNQASSSLSTDRFPIAQGGETLSIEPGLLSSDWRPLGVTPTVVSNNGQKEHVIRFADVDYTGVFGEGTKLRIERTGTTPTTSMGFVAASSQYASKTSPAGFSFTDDFTCEAWLNPDTYTSGSQHCIGKFDGTSGFYFGINAWGQVILYGHNGSASNFRGMKTYTSVQITKDSHIAGVLDMSGFTTATCKIYIDGDEVPVILDQGGTNPTALTQAGNLSVGGSNGANNLVSGRVTNARVWSTMRTAAQIRDNMNQETPASTTGLVAQFKGNGSWNDSSANLNHLTASGGAINNYAAHIFRDVEFAVVTKKPVFSGGNTDVTLFTGDGTLPNEMLGATSYSSARAPFGFPASRSKWTVMTVARAAFVRGVGSSSTHYVTPFKLVVPSGEWTDLGFEGGWLYGGSAGSTAVTGIIGLTRQSADFANVPSDERDLFILHNIYGTGTVQIQSHQSFMRRVNRTHTSKTEYYINGRVSEAGGGYAFGLAGSEYDLIIRAVCAYI